MTKEIKIMANTKIIKVKDIAVIVARKKIKNIVLSVCPPDGLIKISIPESLLLNNLHNLNPKIVILSCRIIFFIKAI